MLVKMLAGKRFGTTPLPRCGISRPEEDKWVFDADGDYFD
jgi:hypothetical protein